MSEVKFKHGDSESYKTLLASTDGVDDGTLYFVSQAIESEDNVDFGGTIYKGNDALGTTCADHLKTVEDIQIAGGPLANNVADSVDVWPTGWTDAAGNKIIPAGKSVQEILTAMFLKVVNGTVAWGTASWSPSLAVPTVSLSKDGTVEVGTSLSATIASNSTVSNNTRKSTLTASQGYFESLDGTWKNTTKTVSVSGTQSGDPVVAVAWNAASVSDYSALTVVEGTNTLKGDQSGVTVSVDALPETTVYGSTNTKSILKDVSATLSDTKPADKALTSTKSDTVTGKYYYFLGYSDNTTYDQFDSASVRALTTKSSWVTVDGTTTVVDSTAIKSNGKSIVIACPAKYKLATVANGLGADILANFSSKGNVAVETGVIDTEYTVYVYPITNGAEVEFKNVTLTKA